MWTTSVAAGRGMRRPFLAALIICIALGVGLHAGGALAQEQQHQSDSHVTDPPQPGKQHAIHGGKNVQPSPEHVEKRRQRLTKPATKAEKDSAQQQPNSAAPGTESPRR